MLKIETKIDPVEINGEAIRGLPQDENQVTVLAHWNYNSLVILNFKGCSVTVPASDLERAIQNARNH